MLHNSIVAATTIWPARGKRLTGCSGSPSPMICRCTSRALLRTLPPGGYGRSCSRICSSRTWRSRSSSSFVLSSRSWASCAALSSCGGGSTCPSFPGVLGSSFAAGARLPSTASYVSSVVSTAPSIWKHSLVGSQLSDSEPESGSAP